MKNYHLFYNGLTEEELAENEHFREWVIFKENDKEAFWNHYLELNPHKAATIFIAKEKVKASLNSHAIEPLTAEEKSMLKHSIYEQIDRPFASVPVISNSGLQILKLVAVILGLVLVPLFFLDKKKVAATFIVKRKGSQEPRRSCYRIVASVFTVLIYPSRITAK